MRPNLELISCGFHADVVVRTAVGIAVWGPLSRVYRETYAIPLTCFRMGAVPLHPRCFRCHRTGHRRGGLLSRRAGDSRVSRECVHLMRK